MAEKVANPDEKSIDALDRSPSYAGPAEKSVGQERVEELNRGFLYFNGYCFNGYTDNRDLIGRWIGRQGRGAQAGTTYWFGSRSRLQFNFRQQGVSQQHIQGGGTLTDVGARGDYWVRSNLELSASVRYGGWLFPVIQLNAQRNVTVPMEIQFHPEKMLQRSSMNATGCASVNGGRL